jgi:hypothetical protein
VEVAEGGAEGEEEEEEDPKAGAFLQRFEKARV